MQLPVVLTIAGSDCSGGAGIQADLKTITELGCYGMSVITALTAQNTQGVQDVAPVPASFITKQWHACVSDIAPQAIKVGMVYGEAQICAVADALEQLRGLHVVVDPVMISTSGDPLLQEEAMTAWTTRLFPLATLLTPNLPEASALCGYALESAEEMEQAARELSMQYHTAVLVKGGHHASGCNDVLCAEGEITWFYGAHVSTKNTHGTGCTLSSAIASYLAKGESLKESIKKGKFYVTEALNAGLELGKGHGPVCHNFAHISPSV